MAQPVSSQVKRRKRNYQCALNQNAFPWTKAIAAPAPAQLLWVPAETSMQIIPGQPQFVQGHYQKGVPQESPSPATAGSFQQVLYCDTLFVLQYNI